MEFAVYLNDTAPALSRSRATGPTTSTPIPARSFERAGGRRRRPRWRRRRGGGGGGGPVLLSADGTSVYLPGHAERQGTPRRSGRRRSSTRWPSRPARRSACSKATTTACSRASRRFSIPRPAAHRAAPEPDRGAAVLPASRASARKQLTREQGSLPGSHQRKDEAVSGRARRRIQVPRQGDPAAGLPGGHAAAGDLLVLPARVHRPGGVRPAGPHLQQEHVPELRHPVDAVLRAPRLRRGRRAGPCRSSGRRAR